MTIRSDYKAAIFEINQSSCSLMYTVMKLTMTQP